MRFLTALAARTDRRAARAVDRSILLRELDVTDTPTALGVHRVARRSYAVEAELIGFDGIPAFTETLEEMRAQPLRWLGMVTHDGRIAAFVAWQPLAGADGIDIDRVCVDPEWFRRGLRLGFTRVGTVQPVPGLLLAEFRLVRERVHPSRAVVRSGAGPSRVA
ncbi:GNAT family N-acetyltransferase [Streptomyces sp. NPDC056738]|uniref:GNAT family N-acetyltransferase n=1 Tax=Streptomyces sp. NPDC056738 TaxID=3345933 RepID=UPI00369247AF